MKTISLGGKHGKGKCALVDDENYEYLNQWRWYVQPSGYAVRKPNFSNPIYMHKLIVKVPEGLEADHISGDKLDNRKSNLRVATHAQNMRNTKLRNDNTSGYKGVWWHKDNKKWIAEIRVDGVKHHLGSFLDIKEAFKIYQLAVIKYHGVWGSPKTR